MATFEVWTAEPSAGFVEVSHKPKVNDYPIRKIFLLNMPSGYDPRSPDHDPFAHGFPVVTPLLQGFDVSYTTAQGQPLDRPLRQLRIDVLNNGWNVTEGQDGIESQGPNVEVIVGLRDNSGGDPPDDAFVAFLHISALVIY